MQAAVSLQNLKLGAAHMLWSVCQQPPAFWTYEECILGSHAMCVWEWL